MSCERLYIIILYGIYLKGSGVGSTGAFSFMVQAKGQFVHQRNLAPAATVRNSDGWSHLKCGRNIELATK